MKIGMILDQEFPPDTRVENEIRSLVKNSFQIHLLCFTYSRPKTEKQTDQNIHIIRIPKPRNWVRKGKALINTAFDYYTPFWKKRIQEWIERYRIDVLHVHDLYLLGAALKVRKENQFPIVADLHENYVDGLRSYRFANTFPGKYIISIPKWRKKEIEWCHQVDYIITVIEEAVDRYNALGIPEKKITVVSNYVDPDQFLQVEEDRSIIDRFKDHFAILYYGSFDIHRGLGTLIRAMPLIKPQCPHIKLVLVGKGKNFPGLQKLSKKLGMTDSIAFEGYHPPSHLPSYIKASDIGLIPHIKTIHTDNTIPHKLFQYMLMGKAVVATNCDPIQRIINETGCGLIYPTGDHEKLAQCIIDLYHNKPLQSKMGERGKKSVLEKYNWEKTSKNLIKLYKGIGKLLNES
ncbi:glycosyltransferase family 4 protein [bacterium]|nr:glycosyltransferase family 4 protein [bacterium]